jgi:hypothetical protein
MQLPNSLFIFHVVVSSQSSFWTRRSPLHTWWLFGLWHCVKLQINFIILEGLVASVCRVTRLVFSIYWSGWKEEVGQWYKKVCKDCGKPETWKGLRDRCIPCTLYMVPIKLPFYPSNHFRIHTNAIQSLWRWRQHDLLKHQNQSRPVHSVSPENHRLSNACCNSLKTLSVFYIFSYWMC